MPHADYLTEVCNPGNRQTTVSKVVQAIRESKLQFDCIAVRGVSGLGFGAVIAHQLEKSLAIVRKSKRGTHSWHMVEAVECVERYLIVDDLIDSGTTVKDIVKKMKKEFPEAKLVGCYLYHDHDYKSFYDMQRALARNVPSFKINSDDPVFHYTPVDHSIATMSA